jgi:hypothetical protein
MRARLSRTFTAVLILISPIGVARGDVFDPTWEPAAVVDTGAIDISTSNGSAMEHTPDWTPWAARAEWHLVYAKGGEIYHAALLPAGWQAPEALTNGGANARDPKIAFARDRLLVVWEDDRNGHPEIWCRMWDGASWSAEFGVTNDATPSRMPAIVGSEWNAYLAWEEGEVGETQIVGRQWDGFWGPSEDVSSSPAYAVEPTVAGPDPHSSVIAWTDKRHGESEIYLRERGFSGFGSEVRVTDFPGPCRRPSAHSEWCCGDVIGSNTVIAFENDVAGSVETWTACYEFGSISYLTMASPPDGRSSERPQVHGYTFLVSHDLGGLFPRYILTWTDAGIPGARQHPFERSNECGGPGPTEVLSTVGLGTSAVAGIEGNPDAGLLTAWIEERDGERSLMVRRGSILGCEGFTFRGPAAILLTPEGAPANVMTASNDYCSGGDPVEGLEMRVIFDPTLDGHLTWDALQQHPALPPQATGVDGRAAFPIRGGGCWPSGRVSLRAAGVEVLSWTGAKSPDIDGDCVVLHDDLVHVSALIGTSDFCADLDGSGTVTEADVAIVQAAMGQICSQLAAVDVGDSPHPALQVLPNPSRGEVIFQFAVHDRGPVDVELFDAAGRLVRGWPGVTPIGVVQVWRWDGRDASAREVPSGVYFVRVRAGGDRLVRSILITR